MASIEYYATGRRKTSTARVFLRPGKGAITINHREFEKYLPDRRAAHAGPAAAAPDGERARSSTSSRRSAAAASTARRARCASRVARALVDYNAELRKQLKKDGLLTSDSRVKERKKYGMAGARKRFQFSKR